MCLARSSPIVLTWFTAASSSGLQHPYSGTLMPSGASTPSRPLDGHAHLSSPALIRVRTQPAPDHVLEPADHSLWTAGHMTAPDHLAEALNKTLARRGRPHHQCPRHPGHAAKPVVFLPRRRDAFLLPLCRGETKCVIALSISSTRRRTR